MREAVLSSLNSYKFVHLPKHRADTSGLDPGVSRLPWSPPKAGLLPPYLLFHFYFNNEGMLRSHKVDRTE